jgi:hypothetical protein
MLCRTRTEEATWTKSTEKNWKLSVSAPKVLGFSLGGEYGQVKTDSQGGTTSTSYQTTVTNAVDTVISP